MALFSNRLIPLFCLLFLVFINQLTLASQNRIALVIGNANYKTSPLKNPVNDARDMSVKLRQYGFKVEHLSNATARQMEQAISRFGKKLNQKDSVGLFYFAGHGVQVNNRNYLLPVGANIEGEADVKYEAVDVGRILDQMALADNGLNLMVLDACRNNPFVRSFRSASRGLAKMHAPNGSVILYATSPGDVAADGSGKNGLFTEKLMQTMNKKGLKIEEVFKQTAIAVSKASSRKQVPYFEGVILGDFYFNGSVTVNQAPIQLASVDPDMASKDENIFWGSVKNSNDKEMYEAYLNQYPKGKFAILAKIKLKRLAKQNKTEPKPSPQPIATYANLTIRSNVYGDTVSINGEDKGSTKLDINLQAGDYVIEVTKEGYYDYEKSIRLSAGVNQTLYAKLNKKISESASLRQYGIDMVNISGGYFQMGSPGNEKGRESDEQQHRVYVDNFKINKTEVTLKPFRQFVNATGYTTDAEKDKGGKKGCYSRKDGKWDWYSGRDYSNPGINQNSNHPVVCVSHNDAMAYINWLNKKTGKSFHLPTEAEWEYAARGGKSSSRFWGNNPDKACKYANVADNNTNDGISWKPKHNCNDGVNLGTAPVGNYKSNPYGLKDMLGNVWEWTCSKGQSNYSGQEKQCHTIGFRLV